MPGWRYAPGQILPLDERSFWWSDRKLLQKWDDRARRLYPRKEITGEGLMLGARTVLARMAQDERGRPRLVLRDEPRVMARATVEGAGLFAHAGAQNPSRSSPERSSV